MMTDRPEELGFDPASLERAFAVVRRFVDEQRIPGAVATAGSVHGMLTPRGYGYRSLVPERQPISADTIFDCASLTKVVVTTTLTLMLLEAGIVRLDDAVGRWIPEFVQHGPDPDRESKERITLRHLLTHTSGLSSWAPLYADPALAGDGRSPVGGDVREGQPSAPAAGSAYESAYDRVIAAVCRQPLAHRPGTTVEYSCLGFILLGEIIRRLKNAGLDTLAAASIFAPLAMADATYNPPPGLRPRIAATELIDGLPLVGVVHDENARAMGGVSGNAGLFATAADLGRFALMLLGKGRLGDVRLHSPAALEEATRDHTGHLGTSRGLGWVVKGTAPYSSAGDLFSPQSFGHTGFTGTSLWVDPVRGIFAILLTNRVHPTRENDAMIRRLRALFHNAVAASV